MSDRIPPRIRLRIDRVTLHGVQAVDSAAIAGQLRSELMRLLAEPGFYQDLQARSLPNVHVAEPLRAGTADQGGLGAQAAAAIVRGLRS